MYHAHPSEFVKIGADNNNCAPIALSIAFGVSYEDAKAFAVANWDFAKSKGKGSSSVKIIESFETGIPIFGKKARKVVTMQNYPQGNGIIIPRRMKLSTFLGKYPTGTYFITVSKHALCVVDGKLVDSFISLDRKIEAAWEVTPANLPMVIPAELPTIPEVILEENASPEEMELPTVVEVIFEEAPSQEVVEVVTEKLKAKKRKVTTPAVVISE